MIVAKNSPCLGMSKSSSIVVIPTCNRPELLALCLRSLSQASGCPKVHIYADTAANINDVAYARDTYFPTTTILHAQPHITSFSGCWNILNSIKDGSRYADDVYLVEEDVMVYPNFFSWHEAQREAASCGRQMPTHPEFLYYTNPGSLLRRPLLDALIPHIRDEYFQDTVEYCAANFAAAPWTSTLDDGLIRRVLAQQGLSWKIPPEPVCVHQGFRGYDKLDIFKNDGVGVEERIGRFLEICELIQCSSDWRFKYYARDFEPYNPSGT